MTVRFFLFYVITICFFASCVSSGSLPSLRVDSDASEKGKISFIELKDGTIVDAGNSKITNSGNITIGDKKYTYKEINAYQHESKYHRKSAYGGFVERVIKGRINGFRERHSGASDRGPYDYYLYYIQKGDNGSVVAFETKVLRKMIDDYQPAVDLFNKYQNLSSKEKRQNGDNLMNDIIYAYNHR